MSRFFFDFLGGSTPDQGRELGRQSDRPPFPLQIQNPLHVSAEGFLLPELNTTLDFHLRGNDMVFVILANAGIHDEGIHLGAIR